jgi:hypothetical protein
MAYRRHGTYHIGERQPLAEKTTPHHLVYREAIEPTGAAQNALAPLRRGRLIEVLHRYPLVATACAAAAGVLLGRGLRRS